MLERDLINKCKKKNKIKKFIKFPQIKSFLLFYSLFVIKRKFFFWKIMFWLYWKYIDDFINDIDYLMLLLLMIIKLDW